MESEVIKASSKHKNKSKLKKLLGGTNDIPHLSRIYVTNLRALGFTIPTLPG